MSPPAAHTAVMRPLWHHTPAGYARIPPSQCPACGWGWPEHGRGMPQPGFVRCTCRPGGTHTTWTCPVCSARVAEGCTDPTRWASVTTPAGLPPDARWGITPELMREEIEDWED